MNLGGPSNGPGPGPSHAVEEPTRIQLWFADYADDHRSRANKICHFIGIPMIFTSIVGLFAHVPMDILMGRFAADMSIVGLVALVGFYLLVEWRLALIAAALSGASYWVGLHTPWWGLIGLQVIGWALQLIGHGFYEKRRPAFVRNLIHVLIGPLWIINEVVGVVEPAATRSP